MDEKIKIEDQSGDHKYFTIIPNYILNHSTATAQALYLQLKRLAGENGIAYPSSKYLRERLKISQPTLRKEFSYLLQKGWIKYIGDKEVQTDGGVQKIKSYKIVDLWKLNTDFYSERGEKIATPSQRGEKIDTKGVKTRGEKIAYKEEPSEQEPSFKKNQKEREVAVATRTPGGAWRCLSQPAPLQPRWRCTRPVRTGTASLAHSPGRAAPARAEEKAV